MLGDERWRWSFRPAHCKQKHIKSCFKPTTRLCVLHPSAFRSSHAILHSVSVRLTSRLQIGKKNWALTEDAALSDRVRRQGPVAAQARLLVEMKQAEETRRNQAHRLLRLDQVMKGRHRQRHADGKTIACNKLGFAVCRLDVSLARCFALCSSPQQSTGLCVSLKDAPSQHLLQPSLAGRRSCLEKTRRADKGGSARRCRVASHMGLPETAHDSCKGNRGNGRCSSSNHRPGPSRSRDISPSAPSLQLQ